MTRENWKIQLFFCYFDLELKHNNAIHFIFYLKPLAEAEWQSSTYSSTAQVSISVFTVLFIRMKAGRGDSEEASEGFDIFLFIIKLSDLSEERGEQGADWSCRKTTPIIKQSWGAIVPMKFEQYSIIISQLLLHYNNLNWRIILINTEGSWRPIERIMIWIIF